jgi:hypothetical protein
MNFTEVHPHFCSSPACVLELRYSLVRLHRLELHMKKLIAVWAACAVAAFVLVKVVKIGPVIFTISAEHGWGVHSGDLLVIIPVAVALYAAVRYWKKRQSK